MCGSSSRPGATTRRRLGRPRARIRGSGCSRSSSSARARRPGRRARRRRRRAERTWECRRVACRRPPAVAWSVAMKIARVEALHCDGGWRPWTFVRIETDKGLVGWGECSDNRSPHGIAGCVRDLAPLLVGQDPRPVERLYWDLLRATRQNLGGVSHKAIAGIERALWGVKAQALGVPVYELFGGPLRDRMRLHWSHCRTTLARMATMLGTPPLRTYDDI